MRKRSGPARSKAPEKTPVSDSAKKAFLELGLSEEAALGACRSGFSVPFQIQKDVIPAVVSGKDVIGCSETGSGKTASFVLPIFDRIDFAASHLQVVALVPTRELCRQVAQAFKELGAGHPLRVVEIYGGVSYSGQFKKLSQNPQVMVGTPGRVLDLLGSRNMNFKKISILVLDEADRMLDMGFMPQIRKIMKFVPRKRQTLMFSATIPAEVSRFASFSLTDPVNILVGERSKPPSQVVQEAVDVMVGQKEPRLMEIIAEERGTILVFTRTKSRADSIYYGLKRAGHNVCVIHSNRTQMARQRAIDGFRSGKFRIMVATDLAQRGLDIEGISLVINYDLPDNPDDYVHRIGRTGRASAPGRALSFVTYKDYSTLKLIEKITGHTFKNFAPPKRSLDRRASRKRKLI
jgi:ATP-dependent RNA helicase RhlE